MTLAILELNDQALVIQSQDGQSFTEPGFAQLTATGIESGDNARATAWLKPQTSYNQYWRQLNQLPLPKKQQWARHHGDIAYSQIKHMLDKVGSPSNLILAVPGCFTDDQLALILGLAQAIPVQVDGVIDSALAIGLQVEQPTLLVDLQLQQSVVSVIKNTAGATRVSAQEVIPDLGTMNLYNGVSRHISDRLIADYRHDPLHTSEGEQAIYDNLPKWLLQLNWETEISVSLPSPRGELPLMLRNNDIRKIFEQRLAGLDAIIAKYPSAQVSFAHSARLLPALLPRFSRSKVMAKTAAVDNCLVAEQQIVDSSSTLHRITRLTTANEENKKAPPKQRCATHLLYKNYAWPLNRPLSIFIADSGLIITKGINNRADVVTVIENQEVRVIHQSTAIDGNISNQCEPGSEIMIAGHSLTLIEVSNA
jgi:hypothetical protein